MTYNGLNKSLALQPHSNDIFDANYHPDLDALIALRFKSPENETLDSYIPEPGTDERAKAALSKILIGACIGLLVLFYVIYNFMVILGH